MQALVRYPNDPADASDVESDAESSLSVDEFGFAREFSAFFSSPSDASQSTSPPAAAEDHEAPNMTIHFYANRGRRNALVCVA